MEEMEYEIRRQDFSRIMGRHERDLCSSNDGGVPFQPKTMGLTRFVCDVEKRALCTARKTDRSGSDVFGNEPGSTKCAAYAWS